MAFKIYHPIHEQGQIVEGFVNRISKKGIQIELIKFIDFFRNDLDQIVKRYRSTDRTSSDYIQERWIAKNIETGIIGEYKVKQSTSETINEDFYLEHVDIRQLSNVENTYEVNLLQDSLDEWLTNERDLSKPDPVLRARNQRHRIYIKRMQDLFASETNDVIKQFLAVSLAHAQTPTLQTLRAKRELLKQTVCRQVNVQIYEKNNINSSLPYYKGGS